MNDSVSAGFTTASKIGCIIIAILSIFVLIGWSTHLMILESILPGYLPMNPVEAVCFIAASLALFLRTKQTELTTTKFLTINILGLFVVLIGSFTFANNFINLGIRFDTVLFVNQLGQSLISPNSALNFILIGLALMVVGRNFVKTFAATQFFTLAAGIITMFAGVGYLYNAISFYQISKYSAMPLNTACAFALFCLSSLLSTHNFGMMKILTQNLKVSSLARKLIATAIILPITLGILRLVGLKFVDTAAGTAFLVVTQIIVFTIIIWIVTNVLYTDEEEKKGLLKSLEEKGKYLENVTHELSNKNKELESANKRIRELLLHEQRLQEVTGDD